MRAGPRGRARDPCARRTGFPVPGGIDLVCTAEPARGYKPDGTRSVVLGTPLTSKSLVFLLYQKGRDSRIFEAQDRAIDDFTLKGICAGIIRTDV
jgi:hypothetical protein